MAIFEFVLGKRKKRDLEEDKIVFELINNIQWDELEQIKHIFCYQRKLSQLLNETYTKKIREINKTNCIEKQFNGLWEIERERIRG